jgi:acetolactate synthase-1/2/3 large subunit
VQGVGAFQDTSGRRGTVDAAAVFGAVSNWCARAARADDVPGLLASAIDAALRIPPGPSVLLLAKDIQRAEISPEALRDLSPVGSEVHPPDSAGIGQAASHLRTGTIVILAGGEVARCGAQRELASVADLLDAKVAVTPDARDAFDNDSPRFVGVCGAMGSHEATRAIERAEVCLVVGTRLPLLARQGLEAALVSKMLVSLGREPPFVASKNLHVECDVLRGLRSLSAELISIPTRRKAPTARPRIVASGRTARNVLDSRTALAVIDGALAPGGVVLVDAGNTGATAAHDLRAPLGGRWLLAMGMAGMGYTFGAAVGAACATGRRCTVLAGDGAFFMNGFDVHTAVEHRLPVTYIIFNNNAHGMCLVRERLLLQENAGYNAFRPSHIGAGLGAMFPGLSACDCRSADALASALERAAREQGPVLIALELDEVEIPPFAAFQSAIGEGVTTVSRKVSHEDR